MIAGCCCENLWLLFPHITLLVTLVLILSFNTKISSLNLSFSFCKESTNLLYFFYVLLLLIVFFDLELSRCLGGDLWDELLLLLLLLLFCNTFYDDCFLVLIFSSLILIISVCFSVIIFYSYEIVFSRSYVLICKYLFWYYNCNLCYFSFCNNFCVSSISLINFDYKNCFDDWRLCFDFK